MFFQQSNCEMKTILIVYANDIILTGDNIIEIEVYMTIEFEVNDIF